MRGEYNLLRSQLRGYLFEIIILELLLKNGFVEIDVAMESEERVRKIREGFIEIKGRGCWHQIDCPCDYRYTIPFLYPLRLIGEVKFYKKPLEKKHIREYIGVIKDIQENYFVADGVNPRDFYPRKLEVGVYFSANGFQAEAEKLAYAHGIKTISYSNNYLIDHIKTLIIELEENYMSVKCIQNNNWKDLRRGIVDIIRSDGNHINDISLTYCEEGYVEVLNEVRHMLVRIRTSFIATTATGVFLHFVGEEQFPEELFQETDMGQCCVYYELDDYGNRYFWMEFNSDIERRRFYFTPPESLEQAVLYGREVVINEKERLFQELSVNIVLNGISRNLTLRIDRDWLDIIRYCDN